MKYNVTSKMTGKSVVVEASDERAAIDKASFDMLATSEMSDREGHRVHESMVKMYRVEVAE